MQILLSHHQYQHQPVVIATFKLVATTKVITPAITAKGVVEATTEVEIHNQPADAQIIISPTVVTPAVVATLKLVAKTEVVTQAVAS